jgi:hypothetical protein
MGQSNCEGMLQVSFICFSKKDNSMLYLFSKTTVEIRKNAVESGGKRLITPLRAQNIMENEAFDHGIQVAILTPTLKV